MKLKRSKKVKAEMPTTLYGAWRQMYLCNATQFVTVQKRSELRAGEKVGVYRLVYTAEAKMVLEHKEADDAD